MTTGNSKKDVFSSGLATWLNTRFLGIIGYLIVKLQRIDGCRPPRGKSDANHDPSLLDFAELMQLPRAAPGAGFAAVLPVSGGSDIRVPEGPGTALAGPNVVNHAVFCLIIEEDAVAARELLQAFANADPPNVLLLELFDILFAQLGREPLDILFIHPDVASLARAAFSALGAFES